MSIPRHLQMQLHGSAVRQEEVSWPFDLSLADGSDAAIDFTSAVVDGLHQRGYCKISVPDLGELRNDVVTSARQNSEFSLPHMELEEGMLGRRSRSKVAFIGGISSTEAAEPLAGCLRRMEELADALASRAPSHLGFSAIPGCQQLLLREPIERGERRLLSPGPLTEEQVEEGLVEEYLGFLQNRRLCILYVLASDRGTLELYPAGGKASQATRLQMPRDTIVVFRHDQLSYAYVQGGKPGADVAIQGWVLSQQEQMALEGVDGNHEGLEELYGGPKLQGLRQPTGEQVNIMDVACRMPAHAYGLDATWSMFSMQTDTFLEIPLMRWDVSLYYTDTPEKEFLPKSYTKHSGMVSDAEIQGFDNKFFNIPDDEARCMAPLWRLEMEITYEALQKRGYSLDTLRGRNIPFYLADIGNEFDILIDYYTNPTAWLAGRTYQMPASTRIAYQLGLTGATMSIDTACSSSLVASNLLFSYLRKRKDPTVTEGVLGSMMNCLDYRTYIGLSAAGMLGRSGRCKSFDNSANGYARGEAFCAAVYKAGGDARDVQERLATKVGGFINQDGRSASLTAPNGPSQQECLRSSQRLAGIVPQEVWTTENHGTGTALGDPIEVGSVRACFWKNRPQPIAVTTGKSHIGHGEASAGLCGIIKTINTIRHSTAPAQCHLMHLNAHIDDAGFPGIFPVENCPLANMDREGCIGGLNSFGFGGTNARGEIWAYPMRLQEEHTSAALGYGRQREATPQAISAVAVQCESCQNMMCYLCGVALPAEPIAGRRHRCSDIREQVTSYDTCSLCYTGNYHYRGEESYALEVN